MASFTDKDEDFVNRANNLLIHQDFQSCLHVCEKGLASICAGGLDVLSLQRKEALCVVALQAYAESNKWRDVQTFLEFWYGDVSRITPTLIKLSLLLFVKVGDTDRAEGVALPWLENIENLQDTEEFKSVLKVYIRQVLLPQELHDKAQALLQSCDIFTEQEKQELMRFSSPEQSNTTPQPPSEEDDRLGTVEVHPSSINHKGLSFMQVLQRMYSMLLTAVAKLRRWSVNPGTYPYVRQLLRLLLLSAFIYSLLFMTGSSPAMSPGSGISQLWNAVVQAWKSLFYPYHLAPLQ